MRYVKWTIIIVFWACVAAFLHYTMPQTDIGRITEIDTRRTNTTEHPWFWAQGDVEARVGDERDVFFIQTVLNNGDVMVYRNEDTGWGWPPYFKFDTSNLQAEAANLRSTAGDPQWVAIKHYGWRNEIISIYPNAISVRPVAGPDVRIVPWLNIVILVTLVALVWAIYVRWRRFRRRRIDPALDTMGDRLDEGGSRLRGLFGRR